MAVGIYNYELTPGNSVPMPKWYFILHGQNDMENAQVIVKFYQYLGWHDLAKSFIPTFQSYLYVWLGLPISSQNNTNMNVYSPDCDLKETTTMLQYVSLAYSQKTGVYFSVYYHSSL